MQMSLTQGLELISDSIRRRKSATEGHHLDCRTHLSVSLCIW